MNNCKTGLFSLLIAFLTAFSFAGCSDGDGSKSGGNSDSGPPELLSAAVNNNAPNQIVLTFNEAVNAESSDGFSVEAVFKASVGLTGQVLGSGTESIKIILSRGVTAGETVTVSYDGTGNVEDIDGNTLREFTGINVTTDGSPPQFSSAKVEESDLYDVIVQFNENIKLTGSDGFTISINSTAANITSFTFSNAILTLTIDTQIGDGDTVTIKYSSAAGDVSDLTGNPLADFGPEEAANNIGPPSFVSAEVMLYSTDIISAIFSETLDNVSEMGFTISVNGTPVFIYLVDQSDAALIFYTDTTVAHGDTVTIQYNSSTGTVTDTSAIPLASFGPASVTNDVPLDTTAPEFQYAEVDTSSPDSVWVCFDESLDNISSSGFTITINGTPASIIDAMDLDDIIIFQITPPVVYGDVVTIQYSDTSGTITDTSGNPLDTFGPENVDNSLEAENPNFLSSAVMNASPSDVVLTFDETVTLSSAGGFTVSVDSTPATINTFSGGGSNKITLTLDTSINAGQTVTVEYDESSGNVEDTDNNPLLSFGPEDVLNLIGWNSYSSSPALAIPDDYPTGVTDTINIADSYNISEISIQVNITHTFIGDLIIELHSPNGTSVILHNHSGGSDENIIAHYEIDTPCDDGINDMSSYAGESVTGNWVLFVADEAGADTGTLNSWTLHIKPAP